jgi:hypothetical protein
MAVSQLNLSVNFEEIVSSGPNDSVIQATLQYITGTCELWPNLTHASLNYRNLWALTNLIQTYLLMQDLVSSGLPFAKPNYDGADNYLLSQSDDPLMKVNWTSSLED